MIYSLLFHTSGKDVEMRCIFEFLEIAVQKNVCFMGVDWGWYENSEDHECFHYFTIDTSGENTLTYRRFGPRLMIRIIKNEHFFMIFPFEKNSFLKSKEIAKLYLVDCLIGRNFDSTDFFYGSMKFILNNFNFYFVGKMPDWDDDYSVCFLTKKIEVYNKLENLFDRRDAKYNEIDLIDYKKKIHWAKFNSQSYWDNIISSTKDENR